MTETKIIFIGSHRLVGLFFLMHYLYSKLCLCNCVEKLMEGNWNSFSLLYLEVPLQFSSSWSSFFDFLRRKPLLTISAISDSGITFTRILCLSHAAWSSFSSVLIFPNCISLQTDENLLNKANSRNTRRCGSSNHHSA